MVAFAASMNQSGIFSFITDTERDAWVAARPDGERFPLEPRQVDPEIRARAERNLKEANFDG